MNSTKLISSGTYLQANAITRSFCRPHRNKTTLEKLRREKKGFSDKAEGYNEDELVGAPLPSLSQLPSSD
jgi:hypothetical protein